ncbi:predicted protein [Thalassiosira pseudonana CCMP1335]|uniref:Uncharacterized protein n=1 Tax=Thalassiosira pseudonana TaxID=35128 RepID=B5YLW5_THAPS|nr:predicted protein [Thalassiosira pseudonana CCMP1335]ACI64306.1 predicted protein [Thalassiosira pseudonana CCMP1335]
MRSFSLLTAITMALSTTTTVTYTSAQSFPCPGPPANGCTNGMFDVETCACLCISPFCPDTMGDCNIPTNNCAANQISTGCTRGVDCAWWVNTLKAETCVTGTVVPAGLWKVYSSNTDCCLQNFPYSTVCDVKVGTDSPTKHPTIAPPPESEFEIIPIKFSITGLPDDVTMRELKNEMKSALTIILTDLAEGIKGLKISGIEERVAKRVRSLFDEDQEEEEVDLEQQQRVRRLLRNVDVYFDVSVVRVDDKKFGPLIINEIKDQYNEILNLIQGSSSEYFSAEGGGGNLGFNFCTLDAGQFTMCSSAPVPVRQPSPVILSNEPEGGGLPGWAIALIVIVVLLLVVCIGYCIYASTRDEYGDKYTTNNMYMDEKSYRSRRTTGSRSHRSRRTRATNPNELQIVVAQGQDPSFGDDFAVNTYNTNATGRRQPDPSVYNPNAIDPDGADGNSGILMLTNGEDPGRVYMEDPPLKPKRDPTMYVDGLSTDDPSLYSAKYSEQEPDDDADQYNPESSQSDPDGSVHRMKSMYGIDEESQDYDDGYGEYGMPTAKSKQSSTYMGSAQNAEYARGQQDPSFYDAPPQVGDEHSFVTQEPEVPEASVSGKSGKSKKSKKSKKGGERKKRSSFRSVGGGVRDSLTSSWGDAMGDMREKAKSFY